MTEQKIVAKLLAAAKAAREHAYVRYSGFRVGAALHLTSTGQIVTGCNVENASYGATVCAERTAVLSAITLAGPDQVAGMVDHIVVVTDADPPAVPCALCLQVLQEFCAPSLKIHLADLDGVRRSFTLEELLPYPFSSF